MNQLSWMLYWANVLGNVGPSLFFLGLPCIIAGVLLTSFTLHMRSELISLADSENDYRINRAIAQLNGWRPKMWIGPTLIVVALLMWVGSMFTPSSDTMYAIATSQVGEQVLSTPLASKAEKALEAWLDKQIATP